MSYSSKGSIVLVLQDATQSLKELAKKVWGIRLAATSVRSPIWRSLNVNVWCFSMAESGALSNHEWRLILTEYYHVIKNHQRNCISIKYRHTSNKIHVGRMILGYCKYVKRLYLGEHGRSCFSLLLRGIIQHVWLKGVELCELICCEMTLDLLLVHHTEGQRLFCYLPVVNLLLHCALKDRSTNTRMYFNNVSNRLRKKPRVRWCF